MDLNFLILKLKQEIEWKPLTIPTNRQNEDSRSNAIEFRQVKIEQHFLSAKNTDSCGKAFRWNARAGHFDVDKTAAALCALTVECPRAVV